MMVNSSWIYIRSFGKIIKYFPFLLFNYFIFANTAYSQGNTINQIMQSRMVQIQDTQLLLIDGNRIASVKVIPELYAQRNFSPAWKDNKKRDELIQIIRHIDEEGLNPKDYFLDSLIRYQNSGKDLSDNDRVDFDILLTESLLRLAYHIRFGKVDPRSLDSNWNYSRSLENIDPVNIIQSMIDSDSIKAFIDRTVPRQPFYGRYKKVLAEYRKIREQGGWQPVSPGPTLKPGMEDTRVAELKRRLQVTGDLPGTVSGPVNHFDVSLEAAVKNFQERHRLEPDGLVGKNTLQALNVSVDDRIDQIRVNLERGRWVFEDVQGEFFVINIAGFQAFLVRDNQVVWDARVMVGRPYRKTPVFKTEMKYMVLNPTWTVPPGILRKDILPKGNEVPAYLREKGMDVLDQAGNRINPDSLDWLALSGRNFPYILRQPPGPTNALGRIKFIFPNPHLVYLHDTPNKELFEHPERTFSSGCIRIENPLELAELIMGDREKWNQQSFTRAIETNRTQTIYLPKPLTVLFLYWTVMIDQDGQEIFLNDVYDRDKDILKALDGEFKFSLPEGLPDRYYNYEIPEQIKDAGYTMR